MTINIILPVHNEEENLSECLESIIRQSYKDYRILLSDNNSTESTLRIAQNFQESHESIVIRNEAFPLKSVYRHSVNTYESFMSMFNEDDIWILISDDDRWNDVNYLEHLIRDFKAFNAINSGKTPICVFTNLTIYSALYSKSHSVRLHLSIKNKYLRSLIYFLTPRGMQALCILYGMLNTRGLKNTRLCLIC
jgi:glycosyltransferase involved in cell wall biosynthesis